MNKLEKDNYRKLMRDFKGRVELMKRIPLKELEKMFIELYEYGINDYIKTEKELHPNKTRKEIIISMYKLREKLNKKAWRK